MKMHVSQQHSWILYSHIWWSSHLQNQLGLPFAQDRPLLELIRNEGVMSFIFGRRQRFHVLTSPLEKKKKNYAHWQKKEVKHKTTTKGIVTNGAA